jgi:hypothetical protein
MKSMFAELRAALAEYDPSGRLAVASLRNQLTRIAGGSLLDAAARQRFWDKLGSEDGGELLPLLLGAYVAQRRWYVGRIRIGSFNESALALHVELMLLLEDAGDRIQSCLGDIAPLLLDPDQEVYHVACSMLAGSSCRQFVPIQTILKALSQRGVPEHPFQLGQAIIKGSQYDSKLARLLVDAIGGDENLNTAVMAVIADLPIDAQTKHAGACRVAERLHGDAAAFAIHAIANIGTVSPTAVAIVKSALESNEWYIRAAAAETAGRLRMAPSEIIPKLVPLLRDTEGHDFTVQECAIRALGNYGHAARECLPEMRSLREYLLADGYGSDDLKELDIAIASIGEI